MGLKLKDDIELRDYQKEASEFSTSRFSSLLSIKTGCGKTVIALDVVSNLLNKGEVKKAIIIGTKSSVIEINNDMKTKLEYEDGSSFEPFIIYDTESLKEFYKNSDNDIALLQYEKIHALDLAVLFKAMTHWKTAVLADESHKLKNPKSLLTRSFVAVRRAMKYLVFLTATPLTSGILDLFYQIQILDSTIFKNKTAFMNSFVEVKMVKLWKKGGSYPEIVGYKNLDLMREKIKPICYDYYPTQDTEYIIHRTSIENVDDYIVASEGLTETKDAKIHAARLVDLQHVVDKSKNKIRLYLESIKPHLKEGLITYCHYHETMEMLAKIFDKLKIDYRIINGQVSSKERTKIKAWFNSDPSRKVLLISSAGAQSLNLQSVNNMFFYNTPFGFGAFTQAKGRIERLFSKFNNFKIHFIITDVEFNNQSVGTIDAYKYELISSYGELTSTVLEANEVPKSQLTSFNKKLIDKFKKEMLWGAGKSKPKKKFTNFGDTF